MQSDRNRAHPNESVVFTPIGVIHSPHTDIAGMPIQPSGARGVRGTIEVFPPFAEGLADIEGFERLILIYVFHACETCELSVTPFLDTRKHGIFATRAPCRPNAIGLSVVQLTGRNGTILLVEDIDVLDGTPLLDIKPYVPAFDAYPDARCGWFAKNAQGAESVRSDGRFRT